MWRSFGSAPALGAGCRRFGILSSRPFIFTELFNSFVCRCSSMVELQPSKLVTWVRFPSPAPEFFWLLLPLFFYSTQTATVDFLKRFLISNVRQSLTFNSRASRERDTPQRDYNSQESGSYKGTVIHERATQHKRAISHDKPAHQKTAAIRERATSRWRSVLTTSL